MKKLFSLFVPVMALLLTLSPQTAKADYVDDNLTEPLTIEMPNDGVTASFKIYFAGATSSSSTTKVQTNLQYRLSSNGGAWGAWTNVLVAGTTTYKGVASAAPTAVTLGGGGSPYKKWKIQFRGVNPDGFSRSSSVYYSISLESAASTRQINISGNVMSLIVGYDTSDETAAKAALAAANEIPNEYCFYRLFHYISSISNRMYINASNLIVPATKLKSHCYEDMFYDAKTSSYGYGLQQAPTFLATDFVDKDGNAVSSSFAGLCNGCQNFSSIHVNFQHCYAAGESNLTNWLKNCGTKRTIYAPEAFRTCANNPNTGLSDAVWNGWTKTDWSKDVGPSTHTVTLAVDGTDSYGTLTAASIADVPHGETITVSSNTITINGTTVTATKTSDGGGYNYAFAGWYNGASPLTGNSNTVDNDMTITAHFTRAVNTYYVSFDPDDGSGEMTDQTFTYGVAQNLKANTFTGPAVTVTYNYNGATGGTSPASESVNASFYMWMDDDFNLYEDGQSVNSLTTTNGATVALTAIWDYDQVVTLPSPTKTGYTLVQWEYGEAPIFVIAGGAGDDFMPDEDVTMTAHWTATNYTITYNGLNDVSNSNPATYTIESSAIVLADPGTRAGYTFTGWTDDDNSNAAVTQIAAGSTGNRHFTANWTANQHNVSWVTDGNALTGTYTNGTTAYGTTIVAPETPTKDATAEYTYAFNGWSPAVAATMPDNDVEYTATWTQTPVNYTLTWTTDGDALTGDYTHGTVAYGTTIVAPATPTKTGYAFNGWSPAVAATMPAANTTYTATWTVQTTTIELLDNEDNGYYTTFKATNNDKKVNVHYTRSFTQGNWATLCLPFEVSQTMMTALKMKGRVYEFSRATGNAGQGNQVTLYFSAANKLEAGKCYIVNANNALAGKSSFLFTNVTINLAEDKGYDLTNAGAYNYDKLDGYNQNGKNQSGEIELVGTLRKGILKGSAAGHTYMGLKENKIYYPNSGDGSTVRAYRGVFRLHAGALDPSMPIEVIERVRIVAEGGDSDGVTELEVVNGGLQPVPETRKFIRDGVLYIERGGVIYDAQGKVIEN